ncbi:hypothetical protein HK103_005807 [Boothiomyces macroporosus]|uniref:sphinganine-1-phosphate aldolase n=1 Tax=Boothiomyces macroporosus TaxID=261099 RepID=A0AAD5UHM2_9FUNG|nr:hypothetical protein HK103_005807 [Boothiomyces macroporosus]
MDLISESSVLGLLLNKPAVQKLKNIIFLYFVVKVAAASFKKIKLYGLQGAVSLYIGSITQSIIKLARKTVPGADAAVQKEVAKSVASIHKGMCLEIPDCPKFPTLPKSGLETKQIIKLLDQHANFGEVDWKDGKVSGAVYHGGNELSSLINSAYGKFTVSNPLHPEVFPGVRKMESEIVSMVLAMYNGSEKTGHCGSMTSGGSESIMMSMKAHRDWAFDVKGITEPEIVVPVSVHAAFDKGAQYFGIKIIHIPVDPKTGKVVIEKVARAINGNTIMLAGSTPSFPHGAIDDIPALAELALKHNIGLHVDSCLGGFLVPFMEDAGYKLPFHTDFRVKGVTAISCDTHKYGFAPKGSSVVMYNSTSLRKYQYFVQPNWPGGVYGSPTMAGSRPGALSAGCWASLVYFGWNGYVESTRTIIKTARAIKSGIQGIPELEVVGDPLLSVVAFSAKAPMKTYAVADLLSKKHYHLNVLQFPPSIHIACTMLTPQLVDTLIKDLRDIVELLKRDPEAGNGEVAAIYGTAASVPDRTIIGDVVCGFLDGLTKSV